MVLVPFYVFAIAAASMSDDGSLIRVPLWGCVGGFVGYWNSGWAMDAVAGKLPKDEQSPPYKNIANEFTPLIVQLRVGNRFLSRPAPTPHLSEYSSESQANSQLSDPLRRNFNIKRCSRITCSWYDVNSGGVGACIRFITGGWVHGFKFCFGLDNGDVMVDNWCVLFRFTTLRWLKFCLFLIRWVLVVSTGFDVVSYLSYLQVGRDSRQVRKWVLLVGYLSPPTSNTTTAGQSLTCLPLRQVDK